MCKISWYHSISKCLLIVVKLITVVKQNITGNTNPGILIDLSWDQWEDMILHSYVKVLETYDNKDINDNTRVTTNPILLKDDCNKITRD